MRGVVLRLRRPKLEALALLRAQSLPSLPELLPPALRGRIHRRSRMQASLQKDELVSEPYLQLAKQQIRLGQQKANGR
jgi:hypothetical protein